MTIYKRHKIIYAAVSLPVALFCLAIEACMSADTISLLLSYFSISFGFLTISLSTLIGTDRAVQLQNQIDPLLKTQNKLQTVSSYYFYSFYISLSSITLLVLISLMNSIENYLWEITLPIITNIIIYLFSLSIINSILMFKITVCNIMHTAMSSQNNL